MLKRGTSVLGMEAKLFPCVMSLGMPHSRARVNCLQHIFNVERAIQF